ncbi:MAG: hypothetical protein LUI10_09605 [Lachnospiraceae bacterium]|nr:hypothetical protein [Lachnospiraceae bacterium]
MGRAEIADCVFRVISEYTKMEADDLNEDTLFMEIGIGEEELQEIIGSVSEELEIDTYFDHPESIGELIDSYEEGL